MTRTRVHLDLAKYDEEVRRYIEATGNARIPSYGYVSPTGYELSDKTRYLRTRYSNGLLTEKVIELCESYPGWSWNSLDARWWSRLTEIVELINTNDELPPRGKHEAWLIRQRTAARAGELSDDKVAALRAEKLLQPTPFERFITAANTWMRRTGLTMADIGHGDTVRLQGENYLVGRRAWYYKAREHGREGQHAMPPHELQALKRLAGWEDAYSERYASRGA